MVTSQRYRWVGSLPTKSIAVGSATLPTSVAHIPTTISIRATSIARSAHEDAKMGSNTS
jgi:hypothetical protein